MNLGIETAILVAICFVVSFFHKKIYKSEFYTLIASIIYMAASVNFLIFAHYSNGPRGILVALIAICYSVIAILYLKNRRNKENKKEEEN